MKRFLRLTSGILFFSLFLSLLFTLPVKASLQDFVIESFSADYYLSRDDKRVSTMRVEEVIKARFPNFDQNHGIVRAIPKTYKKQNVDVSISSITDQSNNKLKYNSTTENDNLVLKIGDPDKYVQGLQTYKISYTLKNVTSLEDSHDELYWDVNGDQWSQPFGRVEARIHIPSELANSLKPEQRCFAGRYNATRQNCEVVRTTNNDEELLSVSAVQLQPRETVTFVLGFNDGTFEPDKMAELIQKLKIIFIIASGVLPVLITSIAVYIKWRKYGKDTTGRGVIVPQYSTPKHLNLLSSDVVLNEKLRNQALSATIIDLAVRKYLSIYEIPKSGILGSADYELELLKDPHDLSSEEQRVVDMFFKVVSTGERVKISELKNKLHTQAAALGKTMNTQLFDQGYFRNDPNKARQKYATTGIVILILGFGLAFIPYVTGLGIGLALSGIIILAISGAMPARSLKGVDARDYLLGMRDYMKLAEEDRIKYLQSPEGARQYGNANDKGTKIKLFEKLLPYAMLFGIEKQWGEQFKDVYTQPPDWYHGNWSTFNTVYLASSLSGFNSASTTSFTAPSSSSSSGFGGGGFSGGGGGGGGGGGW